ncbi:MAG: zinc finger Ran-binding domain-containing protein [Candidatus Limnocylindrales bacterium]|nr:zinc finger Ran-binding domain-containing protein [Candidatus Limnocylindrales bacterium]
MPIEFSSLVESIQRGFGLIPHPAIAIALLAGPTAALIAYRLIGVVRRRQTSNETVAALWVCEDCRSVNELRQSRCYRCGAEGDATDEIEVILDQPTRAPATFEVPAGSPFAALGAHTDRSSGQGPVTPVMADATFPRDAIAVGPGRPVDALARAPLAEADRTGSEPGPTVEAGEAAPDSDLASAVGRRR